MANQVIQIWDFPNLTTQQYDQAIASLKKAGHLPTKGRIFHVAAPKPDGGLMVVNLWESKEDFEAYRKVLEPVLTQHDFPLVQPTIYPVYNLIAERKGEKIG
jgi:hypothetical protein